MPKPHAIKLIVIAAAFFCCVVGIGVAKAGHDPTEHCPTTLTSDCVMATALSALEQFDTPEQQRDYASELAMGLMAAGQPDASYRIINTYGAEHGAEFGTYDLMFLAKGFVKSGMLERTEAVLETAIIVSDRDKGEQTVPFDLLEIAQRQAEFGFADAARKTRQKAAILAKAVHNQAAVVHRITEVAAVQRLSGTAQDVVATLKGANDIALGLDMPEPRILGLGMIAREYSLAGLTAQSQASFALMREQIDRADYPAKHRQHLIAALISEHARAGLFQAADQLVQHYGFTGLDDSLFRAMDIFSSDPGAYLDAVHPSSIARLMAIASRIQNPTNADISYGWIIKFHLENADYHKALALLDRIQGSAGHSEAVYRIVEAIARHADDPQWAADILRAQRPSRALLYPERGLFMACDALSGIAHGFLKQQRYQRALPYLEQAFALYLTDPSKYKGPLRGVFSGFAQAGQKQDLYRKLRQISDPKHQVRALTAMVWGYAEGGYLADAVAAAAQAKQVIKTLSDILEENHKMFAYPRSLPSSARGRATRNLHRVYGAISRAFSAAGDAKNARRFTGLAGPELAVSAQVDLVKLYQRQGDTGMADEILQQMYRTALSGHDLRLKANIFRALIDAF